MKLLNLPLFAALMIAVCGSGCESMAKDESADAGYDRPGFVTQVKDGRLWVFREGSKDLEEFRKSGEPAKSISRIGAGPNRMTIRSGDAETIDDYLVAWRGESSEEQEQAQENYDRPGFVTAVKDGRLWVFREGSKDLEEFRKSGEPAKSISRIGAGPNRMTIRSGDAETIDAYMAAK
jgi:hypothetical protein